MSYGDIVEVRTVVGDGIANGLLQVYDGPMKMQVWELVSSLIDLDGDTVHVMVRRDWLS